MTIGTTLVADLADDAMTPQPTAARYIGALEAAGIFTGGAAAGLQMESGVLLSTGLFSSWNGGDDPNNPESEKVERNNARAGDDALGNYISTITYDAAVIEFDLFTTHGQLEMELQFGSEEYVEYIGDRALQSYNDAIFVTVDGVAVSLVPDTDGLIASNTIHPQLGPNTQPPSEVLFYYHPETGERKPIFVLAFARECCFALEHEHHTHHDTPGYAPGFS